MGRLSGTRFQRARTIGHSLVAVLGLFACRRGHGGSPMNQAQWRRIRPTRRLAALMLAIAWTWPAAASDGADNPATAEFFEKAIRPLLAEKCQKCHGGSKPRAGLSLTGRDFILDGGDSGPAAVPGKP